MCALLNAPTPRYEKDYTKGPRYTTRIVVFSFKMNQKLQFVRNIKKQGAVIHDR
jgi:hypothetical protein